MKWLEKPLEQDSKEPAAREAFEKLWSGSKSHVVSLVYVGRGVGCLPHTVDQTGCDTVDSKKRKISKLELAKTLVSWRLEQIPDIEADDSVDGITNGSIFTPAEMEALWEDLECMVKPSWVTSVPATLSSSGPKLKSDQWRTIGSLYLPVTLIRLWSNAKREDKEAKKRQELLHLTMLLSSAVAAATTRVTSVAHANDYLAYMAKYREELQRLFPDYACHCNHHMAMHIGEFLTRYGPVYGWWTFPYERMIGMLQKISTNYKPGEYEETIGRSWHRSSNFRAFFTRDICPQPIKNCLNFFETLVQQQNRNSLSSNSIPQPELNELEDNEELEAGDDKLITLAEKLITDDIRAAFTRKLGAGCAVPRNAKFTNRVTRNGISYTIHETHEGNSGVICKGLDVPFCIEKIIQFPENGPCRGTWFVVRRHRKPTVTTDPYLKYPYLRARIWHYELEQYIEVLPFSEIDSHFAKLAIPWEKQRVAVIVSLSRGLLI
ncbi:hypothetical protein BYT27DRAFT_7163091 [Phlegmacium glaucopus]|nr:hypothetical protein BYT27DRAFT_7163091 [Phlegmacium glaucopus]